MARTPCVAAGMSRPGHALQGEAALIATLRACLPVFAEQFRAPWCVIGSAALQLSADRSAQPADLDIACSADDADRLRAHWAAHAATDYLPADAQRFRSHFTRYLHLPMALEVMGGLEVQGAAGWQAMQVGEITWLAVQDMQVPVPSLREQQRILHTFGRDKDLARAARIEALLAEAGHG